MEGDHEPFIQSVSKEQRCPANGGRVGKKETRTEAKLRVTARKLNLMKTSNIFKLDSVGETRKMGSSKTSLNFGLEYDWLGGSEEGQKCVRGPDWKQVFGEGCFGLWERRSKFGLVTATMPCSSLALL